MEQSQQRDSESGPDSGPLAEEGLLGSIIIIGGQSGYEGEELDELTEVGDLLDVLSTLSLVSRMLRDRRATSDLLAGDGSVDDAAEVYDEYGEGPALISATLYHDGFPVGGFVMVRMASAEDVATGVDFADQPLSGEEA